MPVCTRFKSLLADSEDVLTLIWLRVYKTPHLEISLESGLISYSQAFRLKKRVFFRLAKLLTQTVIWRRAD
jgi:hypothetical protein